MQSSTKMAYLQLFFFIVASLSFMFVSLSHSTLDHSNVKTFSPAKTNEKVTLSLYYETLCPYCASFISNDLVKVFQSDLQTIVNLRLVPSGNARMFKKGTHTKIICQHGEEECYLNTIHSCVIHLWPDVKKHFEFIHCTEQQNLEHGLVNPKEAMWKNCSEKLGLSGDNIKKCYSSGYGYKLQLQCVNETVNLNPPNVFVPWVVVNNQPLVNDYENFVKYVCQDYKGKSIPEACKEQSSSVSSTKLEANKIHPGCYASELRNFVSQSAAKTGPRNKIEP